MNQYRIDNSRGVMNHLKMKNEYLVFIEKMLFLALLSACASMFVYFASGGKNILIPVTNSISLDAKLYEARMHLTNNKLDTNRDRVIHGSCSIFPRSLL